MEGKNFTRIEFYFQFFWLGAEKSQIYVMVLSRGVMLVERLIFFGKEFFYMGIN